MKRLRIVQPHVRIGDPHATSDDPSRLSILAGMFETLVRRAPGGQFRPGLAIAHTLSDDARTWTFTLREGARFHTGRATTADDAAASLKRIRDETIAGELGTTGVFQSYLAGSTIQTVDKRTLTVHTPEPNADLLDLLVDIPVLDLDRLDTFSGSGRYRLVERHDDCLILEGADGAVEYLALDGATERLAAVRSGRADVATDVPPGAVGSDEVEIVPAETTVCTSFMCHLTGGPCARPEVRRALNLAIDVPALIRDVLHGAAIPLAGPLTRRHLGYDAGVEPYGFDPDEARRLLAGESISLTLDVPSVWPDESEAVARCMVDWFAEVGVSTSVILHQDRPAYAEMVREGKLHDAACFDSSPSGTFRVLWEKFHSGHAGPWWLGYANEGLDRLVDAARATVDIRQRAALYRTAYGMLHRDAPWLFLYNPVRSFAVAREHAGWKPTLDGYALAP